MTPGNCLPGPGTAGRKNIFKAGLVEERRGSFLARPLDHSLKEFHFSKACAQPNFNFFWDYMDLEKLEHLKI
jgi:hypothetical protein